MQSLSPITVYVVGEKNFPMCPVRFLMTWAGGFPSNLAPTMNPNGGKDSVVREGDNNG